MLPLLSVLTKGAREAFPLLSSLSETDLSANAILNKVRESGFTVSRQAGLDVIGALRDNLNAARYLRLVAPEEFHDPAKFGVALTNTLSNFSYIVEASGVNAETGERVKQVLTVRSNIPLNSNDVMSVADSYLGEAEKYGNLADYDLRVTNALRNPNYVLP